jgi:hypothetical protein
LSGPRWPWTDVGGAVTSCRRHAEHPTGHVEQLSSGPCRRRPRPKHHTQYSQNPVRTNRRGPALGMDRPKPGRVGQVSNLLPSDQPGYLALRVGARLGTGICGHRTATTSLWSRSPTCRRRERKRVILSRWLLLLTG